VAPGTTPFVPFLSPDTEGAQLLKVREVVARLAVSTATVYALCERGGLRHVRVSNAIRVEPPGRGVHPTLIENGRTSGVRSPR